MKQLHLLMDIIGASFLLCHGTVLEPQGTLRETTVHAKGAGMVLEALEIPDFLTKNKQYRFGEQHSEHPYAPTSRMC